MVVVAYEVSQNMKCMVNAAVLMCDVCLISGSAIDLIVKDLSCCHLAGSKDLSCLVLFTHSARISTMKDLFCLV